MSMINFKSNLKNKKIKFPKYSGKSCTILNKGLHTFKHWIWNSLFACFKVYLRCCKF